MTPTSPFRSAHFVLVSALAILGCGDAKDQGPAAPPVLEVKAVRLEPTDVPIQMEFVGQTKGAIDADVRARVEGVVTALGFEEGREVKEGQLLYSIDPAPYKAKVAQAKGRLAEADTALTKATSDLGRIRPLVKMKAMSERDLDRAIAQEGTARGSVDAAKAALEAAELELSYCQISSPTAGVIGLTKAKVGEFVGRPPNPVILNVVSKLDPIHVKFSISESDYLYFARIRQRQLEQGETPKKRELRMILADGAEYSESGEVTSLERAVDTTTGTIPVEASFPNPQKLIRPGQFAKIKVAGDTLTGVLVVPKRALREIQGQFQAVVISPEAKAESRNVKIGKSVGDVQIVESGLVAGDVVATEGLQKLRDGMPVKAVIEN